MLSARRFRVVAAAILGLLSAVGPPITVAADEMQSIAVLSFAGYDRFVAKLATLGETAKSTALPASIGGFLRRRTGIESLEGLDRARPLGVVVATCDFWPKWHAKTSTLFGTGHTVVTSQDGNGNAVGVIQAGRNNRANATQVGAGNVSVIVQD